MTTKLPTVGYRRGGRSRVFDLVPGEPLPKGWQDAPPKGEHPHEIELGITADESDAKDEAEGENAGTGGAQA